MLSRRDMLRRATLGFGSLALADLLYRGTSPLPSPLAAKPPHFPARAKRIIYIFLDGGLSQVDSYDYKPLLQRDDGKPLPASIAKPKFTFAPTGSLLRSPFEWKQWGQSGAWASDLFPETNKLIDDLVLHQVAASRQRRPFHREEHDRDRLRPRAAAAGGVVGGVWAWDGERESAGVRRDHAGAAEEHAVGVSCRRSTAAPRSAGPMQEQGSRVG